MKKLFLLIVIQLLCMPTFIVNTQRIFSTSYTMDDGLAANRVSQKGEGESFFCYEIDRQT